MLLLHARGISGGSKTKKGIKTTEHVHTKTSMRQDFGTLRRKYSSQLVVYGKWNRIVGISFYNMPLNVRLCCFCYIFCLMFLSPLPHLPLLLICLNMHVCVSEFERASAAISTRRDETIKLNTKKKQAVTANTMLEYIVTNTEYK